MHWKVLSAAMLIIVIAGLLLITPVGQKYTEDIRLFFTKNVGSAISTLSSAVKPKPSGLFTIYLSANKESFSGQVYKVSNSSLSIKGAYQYIRVGDQTLGSKSNKEVQIYINDMNGQFEFLVNGNIKVVASSDYLEIGDYIFSSVKPSKIEMEITPSTFSLTPVTVDRVIFTSVTGEAKRLGDTVTTASLSNSKLEIKGFSGYLKLEEGGSVTLHGLSNYVKGDTFTFV